jgi:dCMP deaminase
MKRKWAVHWAEHADLISSMSSCCRRKVGAVIVDPRNNPISMGFNGPPRGADGSLCGGDSCLRDNLASGSTSVLGCHHAEQNALMNALHKGISVAGCSLIVTLAPCLGCARLIHHSGISSVYVRSREVYDAHGLTYLEGFGVSVDFLEASSCGAPL